MIVYQRSDEPMLFDTSFKLMRCCHGITHLKSGKASEARLIRSYSCRKLIVTSYYSLGCEKIRGSVRKVLNGYIVLIHILYSFIIEVDELVDDTVRKPMDWVVCSYL
ncbi:hypothetical protein V3481_006233 [Fusarium oxysporum f. sp. vasinfectum]